MKPVNTNDWGPVNPDYLKRMIDTLTKGLNEYPRLMALSVILRYPENCEYECNTTSTVITDFIRSLKSQIKASMYRKKKKGIRIHPCRVRYMWVRELSQNESKKHYHVILLFNKDAYAFPGRFGDTEGVITSSLAGYIMEAWMRALKISNGKPGYLKYYSSVEFPKDRYKYCSVKNKSKCYFYLDKNKPDFESDYDEFIPRIEYMAKEYSKPVDDGERNFGCSQY